MTDDGRRSWAAKAPGILAPDRLNERVKRRLMEQAKTAGMSLDNYRTLLANQPTYAAILRHRAEKLGKTVRELLDEDRRLMREHTYPGPDCITPHEVELFTSDALDPARVEHVGTCLPCSLLLDEAVPSQDNVATEQALEGIRKVLSMEPQVEVEEARPDIHGWRWTRQWEALGEAWVGSLAFIVPTLALLVAWRAGSGAGVLLLWMFGMLSVSTILALVFVRWLPGQLSRIAGTLAFACVLVVAVFTYGRLGLAREQQATQLAVNSSVDRLSEIAVRMMAAHAETGRFPEVPRVTTLGRLVVEQDTASSDSAVYKATAAGLPGPLVAELHGTRGTLSLEGPDSSTVQATLVLGKVVRVSGGKVVVRDDSGEETTIDVGQGPPTLRQGTVVGIALPRTGAAKATPIVYVPADVWGGLR